jgi:hypothetical protein
MYMRIQGINRYYSQEELSVTRKGERDKGVKLKGSININFCILFLALKLFPMQFPYVNYSREAS